MKTRLLLFAMGCAICLNAQIPNGTFEAWENYVDGPTTFQKPDKWVGSLATTWGAGFSITKNPESFPAGTGQFSMKIQAIPSIGVRGVALSSDAADPMTNWIPQPTFAMGYKPTSLNLYYKYLPEGGDTMLVMIYFYKNGNLIGPPQTFGTTDTVTTWTALQIPLTFALATPDSATILLMTGVYAQHSGSVLYVDNLSFNGFIGEEEVALSDFTIYPNPTSAELRLSAEKSGTLWMYNLSGSLVLHQTFSQGNTAIGVQHLPSGIYIVEIESSGALQHQRIIIRH